MDSVIRFLGLLSIMPLFVIALQPNHIGDAFAKSYNSRADLCGERLCGVLDYEEGKKEAIENGAALEIFEITELRVQGWYHITFRIYAGNENIPAALLHVSSDTLDKRIGVKSISSHSFDYLAMTIKADDPNTIKAELIL